MGLERLIDKLRQQTTTAVDSVATRIIRAMDDYENLTAERCGDLTVRLNQQESTIQFHRQCQVLGTWFPASGRLKVGNRNYQAANLGAALEIMKVKSVR